MELQALALAVRLQYTAVTLVSDSEVAIAQLLSIRAKSVLRAQQQGLLRELQGRIRLLSLNWQGLEEGGLSRNMEGSKRNALYAVV